MTRAMTPHPVLTQKVSCQQRIPSHIPPSVLLAATYEYSRENGGVPKSGESASSPKFRPKFWIPQMDDRIPGLEKQACERTKDILRCLYVHDVEDTAVDHSCTDTRGRLATSTRKRGTTLPQDPDRLPRPHSNYGPREGEGEGCRTEAQEQYPAKALFLGETVYPVGNVSSDRG